MAVLASPPDAQAAWLERVGTYPSTDELALEFDEFAALVPQLAQADMLDPDAVSAITEVRLQLDPLQGSDTEWDASALASSEHWAGVRRAAGLAVVALCQPAPAR